MSFFKKIFSSSKEEFQEPEVLLQEESPLCPVTAVVEQDNRAAHLYLWGPENSNFGTKSCWVRNLKPAPEKTNSREMNKGIAPMLEKAYCRFPEGQSALKKEDLSFVWLEEGDGVALMEKTEIIAIIPSWSGHGGFFGYARDAKGQESIGWELRDTNEMHTRVSEARECWEAWDTETDPFSLHQPGMLELYEEALGKHDKYYAIDNREWPPRGLYVRNGPSKAVCVTVGLSLVPQPQVEMYVEDRMSHNRIELGMMLNGTLSEDELDSLASGVSGQAAIPWSNITFLGEGHTINLSIGGDHDKTAVLLTSDLSCLPILDLGVYRDSAIRLLWMIPITTKEREHIMEHGSETLIRKLNEFGDEVYSLDRAEVSF
ncbi:MAG: suppressor of fused domain protein [Roseivirga sp.]|nr:suppressor of fused domain protein [Roseivirga sp.]